ncbi:uncharacterized protein LOC101861440 [Aplysia californica]|uniref:Uncharacterized protein LOC101861440 n=1 Tax=Aplysia californica TaxID=6500 RepID=A0ABM0JQI6_APLCA|nr:uncharacterized protein LOC101861440 [Aplysia californica]
MTQESLDLTGVSSGMAEWSSRFDDFTPGRLTDLSVTQDTAQSHTPAGNYSYETIDEDGGVPRHTQGGTQDGHGEETTGLETTHKEGHHPQQTRAESQRHGKTPGRFTRASEFDEDEQVLQGGLDATKSPELVSVSRQHLVQNRGGRRITDQSGGADDDQRRQSVDEERAGSGGKRKDIQGGADEKAVQPSGLERQASKVSLRAPTHDEAKVTLETTKPYRVSSAASVRSAQRSARRNAKEEDQGNEKGEENEEEDRMEDGEEEDVPKGQSTSREEKQLKGRGRLGNEETQDRLDARSVGNPFSPVKSQKSGVTTGSGWDGDVSMESPLGTRDDAEKQPRVKTLRKKPPSSHESPTLSCKETEADRRKDSMSRRKPKKGSRRSLENLEKIGDDAGGRTAGEDISMETAEAEGGGGIVESTVSTLAPTEVKDEVLKNSEEEKQLTEMSKEAYREQRHQNKVKKETRDLEDIQSQPYSSNADMETTASKTHPAAAAVSITNDVEERGPASTTKDPNLSTSGL